jgi:DNA-binding MarR family transcriptional regulator
MKGSTLDDISENLLMFFPLFHKKLMKGGHGKPGRRESYLECPILGILSARGPLPISEVGRRLHISKPNMTSITNKLIFDGKIRRIPDRQDRRVIRIAVTEDGKDYLKEHRKTVKENIKRNIKGLNDRDLITLCESLDNIRIIVSKISDEE